MKVRDSLLAVLACLLWSTAFVGIKTGFAAGAQPFFFAGIRFFISGLILIPVALRVEGRKVFFSSLTGHAGFVISIGFLQTALLYGAFYIGVGMIPASVAAIIIGAQPLFTSVVSRSIPPGEHLSRRQWFSLFLAVLGLVILSLSRSTPGSGIRGSTEITGIIILILALGSGTFSTIWISRTRRDIPPLVLSSGQFLIGGGLLLLASLFTEGPLVISDTGEFYTALIWLFLVSSTGGSMRFHLLRKSGAGAGTLSVWKFIIPLSGALLGWLLIPGDSPDPGSVAGMLLIAVSVLFFFMNRRP
jgi:drug/metabolite transporter (DMT)-like permease